MKTLWVWIGNVFVISAFTANALATPWGEQKTLFAAGVLYVAWAIVSTSALDRANKALNDASKELKRTNAALRAINLALDQQSLTPLIEFSKKL